MVRSNLAALVFTFSACSTPAQQASPTHPTLIPRSQTMTAPAMPFACDLDVAPLASWAEYEARDPLTPAPMRTRVALVGKTAAGNTVEWTYDLAHADFVVGLVFAPDKGPPKQLTKRVMQDGAFDPMEMQTPTENRFYLDPQSLVGTEEIAVRGGSFIAKRYHYLTRFGENVDAWINEATWPICLIKLDAEQKQMPSWPGRFSYELIATGSDARPQITRPPVPYDIEVLKKRDDQQRAREHRPDNAPRVGDTIAP
jgi:hypothetical protein